jgi:SAM-dependent methyltransferase
MSATEGVHFDNAKRESARIGSVYDGRWEADLNRYHLGQSGELEMQHGYERKLFRVLTDRFSCLSDLSVLEVGCGTGPRLADFLRLNIPYTNLVGVDCHLDSLLWAKRHRLNGPIVCADGRELPFIPGTFDVVLFRTVFSSILSDEFASQLAGESRRVLTSGGLVCIYDFRVRSPANRDVRPVVTRDIQRFYPGMRCRTHTMTLAPPLARSLRATRLGSLAYSILELVPIARTHCLWILESGE